MPSLGDQLAIEDAYAPYEEIQEKEDNRAQQHGTPEGLSENDLFARRVEQLLRRRPDDSARCDGDSRETLEVRLEARVFARVRIRYLGVAHSHLPALAVRIHTLVLRFD